MARSSSDLVTASRAARNRIFAPKRGIKFLSMGALCASLAACQTVETSPTTLSEAQRATVHRAVTAVLKDPESARFGAMNAGVTKQGAILVCGYVNAKNSFGGYTGDSPYWGWLQPSGAFQVRDMASDWGASPSNAVAIVSNCRANGVAI